MAPSDHINPAALPSAFAYEHTDIPPGLTIEAWRRQRAANARAQRELNHPVRTRLRQRGSQVASVFAALVRVPS